MGSKDKSKQGNKDKNNRQNGEYLLAGWGIGRARATNAVQTPSIEFLHK